MLSREDRLDRLVAEYADRLAHDSDPRREEMLAAHPELREELLRCFRMIEAGMAPAPAVAARLATGVKLGEFQIQREIGRGAMGVVYLAEQPSLKRKVALKVLRHHLTLEARHVSRFEREARLAARLRHPNVVAIHAVGEEDGHHYIAMDHVPGPTLAQVIATLAKHQQKPTPADLARATGNADLERCASYFDAAVRLLMPVAEALAAAHEAGLVHRDVKPSNILLDAKGNPMVADFGLAKGEGDIGLTFSGEPVGTPYYMAPEQVEAATKSVDARTDVYALGVTLYELLTLRRPFEAPSYPELVTQILTYPPPRPRSVDPKIPRQLESVVMMAIAKDPEDRYKSMTELRDDLERAISGQRVLAKRSYFGWCPRGPLIIGISVGRRGLRARRWDRRALTGRFYAAPYGSEYKSKITILGLPLFHYASGIDPRTGRGRRAVGIIAIGNHAYGGLAIGGFAGGLIAIGGSAAGLLLAIGGAAIGGIAVGGAAAGLVAIGGGAAGVYGWGGGVWATHGVSGSHADPEAVDFFNRYAPFLMDFWNQARGSRQR